MRNLLQHISHIPRNCIAAAITLYQRTLSPDHGPLKSLYPYGYCRHEPTCSEYGKRIILERGVLIGTPLLCWRLIFCNPWAAISREKILAVTKRI